MTKAHDSRHPYWCAVPECPQYVHKHAPQSPAPSKQSVPAGTDSGLREALHIDDPDDVHWWAARLSARNGSNALMAGFVIETIRAALAAATEVGA